MTASPWCSTRRPRERPRPKTIRDVLSQTTYKGLAMTYRSDGKGNMAHSASIVCYDGSSRIPAIVKRYEDVAAQ